MTNVVPDGEELFDLITNKYNEALELKNLDDCYVAVPSQFNERDYEAKLVSNRNQYTIVVINTKTNKMINLNSSIHTTAQIAIDEAYKWFKEKELDITDLSNWVIKNE